MVQYIAEMCKRREKVKKGVKSLEKLQKGEKMCNDVKKV